MNRQKHITAVAALAFMVVFSSCKDANSPGYEYMPDMYRSPAIEAYVDYGQDPYYFGDSLATAQRNIPSARKPVEGTVAFNMNGDKAQFSFPYPYANTPEDYEKAGTELKNPLPMSEEIVEKGKAHYEIFCKHCHGDKGAGDGAVIKSGKYPAIPPAYDGAQLKDLPEGKIFHSLVYGKNVGMGSHASQLSQEERWEVVRYVQYLQNGGNMPGEAPADDESAEEEGAAEENADMDDTASQGQ